jgi:hypothetical protein
MTRRTSLSTAQSGRARTASSRSTPRRRKRFGVWACGDT